MTVGEWLTLMLLFLEDRQVARIARRSYAYAGNIYQLINILCYC